MSGKLDGRIALVTGAARGIGRAIVLKLVAEGARVLANDLDGDALSGLRADVGGACDVFPGDVTEPTFGDRAVRTCVDRLGGLDILVNNAGYVWNSRIAKPTQLSYSAAKSALVGMTRSLAKDWGRYDVTVNCVAFGFIETRLTQTYTGEVPEIAVGERKLKVGLDAAQVELMKELIPLGRVGSPEDAAGAVYLFCAPESDYVSGEVLVAAGGLRM
jgi:3-oxoacyl-[acyl-carrier protein] reductase